MTDIPGILLTAADFVGPAIALWYLALRRKESSLDSVLAAFGLSAFLMPTLMFLLNRTVGYPIDRISLTGLAIAVVTGAIVWHWLIAPRVSALQSLAIRLGRLVGGTVQSDENGSRPPFDR